MSDGRRLARNSALNLVGLALPMLVALFAIPPLLRGLGADRFAILALAWAAVGYFGLFEFGLGRALTQTVAQRLARNEAGDLGSIVWSSLLALLGLGGVAALVLALSTPFLVSTVLNVPEALRPDAAAAFRVLAWSLPFVVTSVGFRGVMEGHQHFGAVTALRLPVTVTTFIGPLVVLPFSRSLVAAVAVLAGARVAAWVAHVVIALRRYRYLRTVPRVALRSLGPLLSMGGWITVSNVISPMMTVMDRFFIGALLPLAAVAHYVTPYEIVVRLLVIPGALVAAIFPAFAASYVRDSTRTTALYDRALRGVVLVMFPLVLITMTFAREGLTLWMGAALPAESAIVLKWLALGVLVNAIGQVPYALLQGTGRADIVAKFHMFELPLYATALWLCTRQWGLTGVAVAWTARVALDTLVLLGASKRHVRAGTIRTPVPGYLSMAMLASLAIAANVGGSASRVGFVLLTLTAFAALAVPVLVTPAERDTLRSWFRVTPRTLPAGPKVDADTMA